MIHLALQTEFTFKQSYLHMKDIHKHANSAVGVADLHSTFGHVWLEKMSKKHGFKPIYGVRLYCLPAVSNQRSACLPWIFIAKNQAGLKEIYEYTAKSYDNFYYIPRLNQDDIKNTGNVIIIAPIKHELAHYVAVGQGMPNQCDGVAIVTNNYPTLDDKATYELLAGARKGNGNELVYNFNIECYPQHILSADEFIAEYSLDFAAEKAVNLTEEINNQIEHIVLPQAGMVHWVGEHDLNKFMDKKRMIIKK